MLSNLIDMATSSKLSSSGLSVGSNGCLSVLKLALSAVCESYLTECWFEMILAPKFAFEGIWSREKAAPVPRPLPFGWASGACYLSFITNLVLSRALSSFSFCSCIAAIISGVMFLHLIKSIDVFSRFFRSLFIKSMCLLWSYDNCMHSTNLCSWCTPGDVLRAALSSPRKGSSATDPEVWDAC